MEVSRLAAIPLFAGLDEADLAAIAEESANAVPRRG
jgi:hypothetical protein